MMYGTLLGDNVNVRQEPNTDCKVLGKLLRGQSIIIDKKCGDWYSVFYGNSGGYVFAKYIEPYMYGKVRVQDTLNIRQKPNTNCTVLGSLKNGELVKISMSNDTPGWYSIFYGSNGGYVYSNYIETYTFGKVNVQSTLNVRQEPNTDSRVIGSLKNNEIVTICREVANGFYSIYYGNNGGYVSKDYITPYLKNDISESVKASESVTAPSSSQLISDNLVNFVKSYEGFYDHPYNDCVGVRTTGYGSTTGWIMKLDHITEAQATQALLEEINMMASKINADLKRRGINLKQYEFDALCSFAYNCGTGALFSSMLYKRVCNGVRDSSLKENFKSWCHGGGRVIKGLLNRRIEEYDIFNKADYIRNL